MRINQLWAYIDEAGQRSASLKSSDHFVMSAVILKEEDAATASRFLAGLRSDLGRQAHDVLHWQNLKQHPQRVHAARQLGQQDWITIVSVVACKRHLTGRLTDDQAYLFTLRLLLERLSWLARDQGRQVRYTLAHVVRFKMSTLREYEYKLQQLDDVSIEWRHVDPSGGLIDQPHREELLQLADTSASATFAAFEPDRFQNTESRYLRELAPRLWTRGSGPGKLTSYGLKMHPWSANTKAAYPWVAAL